MTTTVEHILEIQSKLEDLYKQNATMALEKTLVANNLLEANRNKKSLEDQKMAKEAELARMLESVDRLRNKYTEALQENHAIAAEKAQLREELDTVLKENQALRGEIKEISERIGDLSLLSRK